MEFTIYTDGGCIGNRRNANCIGGYGYVILDPAESTIIENGGKVINTTNNMMEMTAVIEGLKALKKELDESYGASKKHDCIIKSDSKYVCENYLDYLPIWKNNNWRKKNGSPVLNKDLWMKMDDLTPEFKSAKFLWVKGHSKHRFNNRADEIVQAYMKDGVHPPKT